MEKKFIFTFQIAIIINEKFKGKKRETIELFLGSEQNIASDEKNAME